ncbi:hypothetical protein LDL08_30420 [Nonomuraea glycinis]|uniref:Uncharacterized protein n=1 Tax=Nonomuraea glycinis TaxID=2047744 RepID=A0A918E4I2_9ACTN|nr:hypothetical protein [Nonomuraea glycinis]MCA2180504.1 hypothetical protein [Nonomuraea glycinis]GGP04299.1 hypothetical protein GCM10012278_19380 [Nonomuraea glycinis]
MVRLTPHWATLGKQPASLDDYEVIDRSAGAITRRDMHDALVKEHFAGDASPCGPATARCWTSC